MKIAKSNLYWIGATVFLANALCVIESFWWLFGLTLVFLITAVYWEFKE